ncbi:hypothetical protein MIND_00915700 [Mycena indigotica]|uniref:Phosphoglycerate mutase-like protein n=1 Tax=Mycena indigotica TaxID=2126181 RepID=A0A8H6W2D2_9AGAR|nr:uncharacterized protein MIND_00915700 [Mycena indigotica]KAF7296844.1 hypothetical protein MIND_00915700 [Mycena indigotica]
MSDVLGVIVLARNGERTEYYQDPSSYAGGLTDSTPLGVSSLHALGSQLRETYLTPGAPAFIDGMSPDLADTEQIKVRAKAGTEGPVVFDSAIALLQGLFPPTPKNKITLADGKEVVAPLGGYQYVPMETVEPGNDRSMESWTDCPNFKKHVVSFHSSDEFKKKAKEAAPFFKEAKDFVFGRAASLENIWNIHDFMSTQLTYNQTYAYRLPPTYVEQARGFADWHEDSVFSDTDAGGIGNIAGRTMMHTILTSLERIAFNGDPLQMMLLQTTYQPFISLFHEAEIADDAGKKLQGIPNFGSALAIELRKGAPPDTRDFLRMKFLNATEGDWKLVHPFGHKADIPLTEFIYRAEGASIKSNKEWAQVCGASGSATSSRLSLPTTAHEAARTAVPLALGMMLALLFVFVSHFVLGAVRRKREARRVRLLGEEAQLQGPQAVVVDKVRL